MSALSTTPSHMTMSTLDKKLEEGRGHTVLVASPLGAIAEHDADEGAKLAGEVALAYTEEEEKAVRRKVAARIVPILAAVYFSQFLDKNSINYSSVMGLPLKGENYNLGFFIAEIPQSILAQKFPMAKYLGANMVLWAVALCLHSASALFAPFFVFRILLGVFESVVSPILIAIVAAWFPKREQARVVGAFYSMNGVSAIVGGALAYGITKYSGPVDHWRVIYFVLSAMALIVGIAVLVFLPDSPTAAKFLSEREKLVLLERIRRNQSGTVSHQWKKGQMVEALCDPKVWGLFCLMLVVSVPNAAIGSFTSILIKSFGYTSQEALLLNMPCGAVQLITTISIAIWADKRRARMFPFIGAIVPSVVGFALLVAYSNAGNAKEHKGPLLVGILLSQCFVSAISLLYSWSAANIAGHSKKSLVNALMLLAFSGGNLAGSQAFQASTAPRYYPGKIALFCLLVALVPLALAMHFHTRRLNRQKAEQVRALVEANGWTDEDLQREKDAAGFRDLTDVTNPFYEYIC
ncbi:hypothetical protein JCM3770_003549 [Rhodotorula araucariae]